MFRWKSDGTALYEALPSAMKQQWKECEPLRESPVDIKEQSANYKTWNESKLQP